MALNPLLDIYINCNNYLSDGVTRLGRLAVNVSLEGELFATQITAGRLSVNVGLSAGTVSTDRVIQAGKLEVNLSLRFARAGVVLSVAKTNWVQWSKIGSFDFTQDHSNVAGERMMEWSGDIYAIHKLGSGVVIYGANGISMMKPKDVFWDYKTVFTKGTKGKHAQINLKDQEHYFVDTEGYLWALGEGFKRLGYREFLSTLVSPVISYDEKNELLYLCDGTRGFIYSLTDGCLTKGPVNITGCIYRNSTQVFTAPATVADVAVSFTTGIFDFESRKEKTIFNLEVATAVNQTIEVAIEYRTNLSSTFVSTPWKAITHRGIAYLPCYGIEFKFKFRMATKAAMRIDYFKINGVLHGFSFLDSVRKER